MNAVTKSAIKKVTNQFIESQLVDCNIAATGLGISVRTLNDKKWREKVGLKSYKVGKRRLYKPVELMDFINNSEDQTPQTSQGAPGGK